MKTIENVTEKQMINALHGAIIRVGEFAGCCPSLYYGIQSQGVNTNDELWFNLIDFIDYWFITLKPETSVLLCLDEGDRTHEYITHSCMFYFKSIKERINFLNQIINELEK